MQTSQRTEHPLCFRDRREPKDRIGVHTATLWVVAGREGTRSRGNIEEVRMYHDRPWLAGGTRALRSLHRNEPVAGIPAAAVRPPLRGLQQDTRLVRSGLSGGETPPYVTLAQLQTPHMETIYEDSSKDSKLPATVSSSHLTAPGEAPDAAVHRPATRLNQFRETTYTSPQTHVNKMKKFQTYSCCLQIPSPSSGRIKRTSKQPGSQLSRCDHPRDARIFL